MSTEYFGDVNCPKCLMRSSKVIDSRGTAGGTIRRRRECLECHARFTTFEHSLAPNQLMKLIRQARRLGHLLIDTAKI